MSEWYDYIRSALARGYSVEFFDGAKQGIGCKLEGMGEIHIAFAGSARGALVKVFKEAFD